MKGTIKMYEDKIEKLEKELEELLKLKNNSLEVRKEETESVILYDEDGVKIERVHWDSFKVTNNNDFEIYVTPELDSNGRKISHQVLNMGDSAIPPRQYRFFNLKLEETDYLAVGDILHGYLEISKYPVEGFRDYSLEEMRDFEKTHPKTYHELKIQV